MRKISRLARHLTLRQLQIFSAVAQHGGFSAAAKALHLTQPTVSMQVKKLTEAMQAPLFETSGRQLVLTAEGRELLEAAHDIFDRLMQLEEDCQSLSGVVRGNLRIAGVTSTKYFLPHLLGDFLKRHPQVEPHFSVTNRAQVIEHLRTGTDDIIIMGRAPQELEVEAHAFLDNALVVAAPADHPLAGEGRVPLQALTEQRFLVREKGSGTRLAVDSLFAEHGLTIRPTMELGSSEAIKQAVLAGLGISVLSRQSIEREARAGALAVLDVEHFPLHRQWFAVHLKQRRLSLAARRFLDYLLEDAGRTLASSA